MNKENDMYLLKSLLDKNCTLKSALTEIAAINAGLVFN